MTDDYYVLDADDRIVQVSGELHTRLDPFLGHTIWEASPGAQPLLGPSFAEARRSGRELELTSFYAGRLATRRIVPAGETLAVHVEVLVNLDVRTLGTLAASLRAIEGALAARRPARPGRRAAGSPQALP